MKAKIIKIVERDSKHGGIFYYVFFKGEDGKTYKTCLYPRLKNFSRWYPVLKSFQEEQKKEIWLKNLIVLKKNLLDADSLFNVIR